jgi:hypothetical protein
MREFIIIMAIVFFIVAMFVLLGYLFDRFIICPQFAKSVDLPHKYNFWGGGCFVQFNGQWVRSDKFGVVQVSK